jgi:excisionase family DNA binding protein
LDLLTVLDAAATLKKSKFTVRELIKRGALPAFKLSGVYRIDAADLRAYIERNRVTAGGAK